MIGVIEYDMGNIQSVLNAFEYLGENVRVINEPDQLDKAEKIVLPGVGAFGVGIKNLKERGFIEKLNDEVLKKNKSFLGICLGMQLICKESFEFGRHTGLGWIDASVRRFEKASNLRVPHVGWNNLIVKKKNRLFNQTGKDVDVYFVHSYYVEPRDKEVITAVCEYGIEFAAVIEKGNIFATQFHPEKSQKTGLDILRNFIGVGS